MPCPGEASVNIIERIKAALEPRNTVPDDVEHQLRLATGALLLEMCRADFKVMNEERQSIANAIRDTFELTPDETRELMRDAETESECAVSLQIYTSLINEYSTRVQKLRLIEDLWRVAYADGELHALEENLVIRVAALIEIPPKQVRQIQKQIEGGPGLSPSEQPV